MKSSTRRLLSPMRMKRSCAVMRSYARNVASSRPRSSIAYSKPTIVARSARGRRLKLSNVANTCPSGEGSWRKSEELNTGAVASRPSGEKKLDAVKSVKTSDSFTPTSASMASMFG